MRYASCSMTSTKDCWRDQGWIPVTGAGDASKTPGTHLRQHARGLGGIVRNVLKGLSEHVAAHLHSAAETVAVTGDRLQCHIDLFRHVPLALSRGASGDAGAPGHRPSASACAGPGQSP